MRRQKVLFGFMLGVILVIATGAKNIFDVGGQLSRDDIFCDNITVDVSLTATAALTAGTATITTATITTANITTANITTGNTTTSAIITANITTGNVSTALNVTGNFVSPFDAVSLTSPANTFTATGKKNITLTTDAAITTITITGAAIGQEIMIRGTSDSNTGHFDDGSSFTLAGDMTLGAGDTLSLVCTTVDGDEYVEVSRSNN